MARPQPGPAGGTRGSPMSTSQVSDSTELWGPSIEPDTDPVLAELTDEQGSWANQGTMSLLLDM